MSPAVCTVNIPTLTHLVVPQFSLASQILNLTDFASKRSLTSEPCYTFHSSFDLHYQNPFLTALASPSWSLCCNIQVWPESMSMAVHCLRSMSQVLSVISTSKCAPPYSEPLSHLWVHTEWHFVNCDNTIPKFLISLFWKICVHWGRFFCHPCDNGITTQLQLCTWGLCMTLMGGQTECRKCCVCCTVVCLPADALSGGCLSRTVLSHWNIIRPTNGSHGCHCKCCSSHTENEKGNKWNEFSEYILFYPVD